MKNILRLERVTYEENESFYLRDFDLDVRTGEIMGLLPLNAYGIPALLDVIRNNPPLYYGQVIYDGKTVNSWKDMKRVPNPVTIVDSESSLVAGQSVLTNIFLLNGEGSFFIREKELERKLKPYLEETGVTISPRMPSDELTAFERVIVEILRGVISGHKLIVLKDVSSYIGESNLEELGRILRLYGKKGIAFLFISSRYDEIIPICDRTALMSNGRILMKLDRKMTKDKLKDICEKEYRTEADTHRESLELRPEKRPVMEIIGLEGDTFDETDITIYEGEYSVIHAPDNKTFNELVNLIFGNGGELKEDSVFAYIEKGDLSGRDVAFIRQKADETMVFDRMSYMDNLLFTADHKVMAFWGKAGIKKSIRQEFSDFVGEDVFEKRVDMLSPKERMILVYARVLLQHPKVVFCEMPFNDADISMRLLIRDLQRRLCEKGIAVVILTMNLRENVLEPDRVVQIDGKLSRVLVH